jgi:AcrR family transcriptional regulator
VEDVRVTVENGSSELDVRPPLQKRSREAWARVLDAGVGILEDDGYESFTIAAVCERAGVAPRALYERVDTKDALFLAVYEHGMSAIVAEHAVFDESAAWRRLTTDQAVDRAVRELISLFRRHAALLRSVVLISGVHPEVSRRGSGYTRDLGDRFAARLLDAGAAASRANPERDVRAAYEVAFSALVVRTAYGPGFSGGPASERAFADGLRRMMVGFLDA